MTATAKWVEYVVVEEKDKLVAGFDKAHPRQV